MDDPEFLQSVLRNLPGVDPQSEVVRNAVGNLDKDKDKDKKSSPKKDDKNKKWKLSKPSFFKDSLH